MYQYFCQPCGLSEPCMGGACEEGDWTLVRPYQQPGEVELINLTPHEISVVGEDGVTILVLPPSGTVARAEAKDIELGEAQGVQVVRTYYGPPIDLPEPREGVCLVVSLLTAQAAKRKGRATEDLLLTSDPVRDDSGRIIGCRKFAQL